MKKSIATPVVVASMVSLQLASHAQSSDPSLVKAGVRQGATSISLVATKSDDLSKGDYNISDQQAANAAALKKTPAVHTVNTYLKTDPFISFSFSSLEGSSIGTSQSLLVPAFHTGDIIKLELGITMTLGSDNNGNSIATALTSNFADGTVLQATDGAGTGLTGIVLKTSDFNAFTPSASVSSTQLLAAAGATSPALFSKAITFVAPYDFTGFGFNLLYDYSGTGSTIGFTGKVTVNNVPEPGMISLLLAGGVSAGAGLIRRRRKH